MDVLFRQLRTKYPHGEEEESRERSIIPSRDQILPPQKTQSFRDKRNQSWVRRQFSKQMNQGYDSNSEGDYRFAVAAAAFAIKSLEESSTSTSTSRDDRLRHHHEQDASSTKFKIKPDYIPRAASEPHGRSIRFSDEISKTNLNPQGRIQQETEEAANEKPPEKTVGLVPAIKKKLSFADNTPTSQPERAMTAEKPIGTIPSVKKPLNLNRQLSNKQDRPEEATLQPSSSVPLKETPFLSRNARPEITENQITGNTEAEWERTEMSRIKKKYDKLNATILDWENKKKSKAKRRLDKIQAELDKRRAKAMQHYRKELARIDGIAGGARSQAIENRRNEELEAREKANKIKLTGKLPATCLCC